MRPEKTEFLDPAKRDSKPLGFWRQLRRLLVFQFKLYVDAVRDFLLSFLSFGAFLLDVIQNNSEKESYFERVLKLGQRTEKSINLFEQYEPSEQEKHNVDAMLREVEERVMKNNKKQ